MINQVDSEKSSGINNSLAAQRLHAYLLNVHWRGDGLYGPDPGIRFNYRIGRFLKSYLRAMPWKDDMYYLQAQGYWVLANWELFRHRNEEKYLEVAVASCNRIVETQLEDGCWMYPNREWKGRVATVEGIWACLALMETARQTQEQRYVEAIIRWHEYLTKSIGFQILGDEWAINYFANQTYRARVPNNSADALRFFAELAELTGEEKYLSPRAGLIRFLSSVQKSSGEFPYTVPGETNDRIRPHFQCFQYNAFMSLGLMRYFELTKDASVRPIIEGILRFLPHGLAENGATHYECGVPYRHVTYHSAAMAAAFCRAGQLGFDSFETLSRRAFAYVLERQMPAGDFLYSRGDYRLLSDRRSYPRYLAMVLYHLLHPGFDQVESRHVEDNSCHQRTS